MHRPLRPPLDVPHLAEGITVRTFIPGRDEAGWLKLNNRAFASHPEQGRWAGADLDQREQEPWVDPAGGLPAGRGGGAGATLVGRGVGDNNSPKVPEKGTAVSSPADGVERQVYSGPTPESIQKATTANMDVKVVNQTDAQRLQKDNIVRFTGTLTSYDPAPNFLLHWDKAQVNPADIPPAKPGRRSAGGKRQRR